PRCRRANEWMPRQDGVFGPSCVYFRLCPAGSRRIDHSMEIRCMKQAEKSSRRISVAPMMDWTDRHCRMFHRQITRHTWLYTEMVTTGALLYGDVPRHLDFSDEEHPVALQLGGSEPADLAKSAKLGEQWGYDEINLNCGCPSERVQ